MPDFNDSRRTTDTVMIRLGTTDRLSIHVRVVVVVASLVIPVTFTLNGHVLRDVTGSHAEQTERVKLALFTAVHRGCTVEIALLSFAGLV